MGDNHYEMLLRGKPNLFSFMLKEKVFVCLPWLLVLMGGRS